MVAMPTRTTEPTATSLAQQPTPQEDVQRRHRIHAAWKAYRGELPKPLKVKDNQPDDNILSNRCAPIVDKGVSFLFGKVVKIEASDEATQDAPVAAVPLAKAKAAAKPSPIQDYLDGFW